MKKLIVNADDFGINQSVTDAIIESHIRGIITSTTIMVNMPAFDYAVERSKDFPNLGIGLHINLTFGKPLSENICMLINETGEFKENSVQRKNFCFYQRKKIDQIKSELSLQFEKALKKGIKITHFDSHHHITGLPLSMIAVTEIAKEYGVLKARSTSVKYWITDGTNKYFFLIVKSIPKALIHNFNKMFLNFKGIKTPDYKIIPNRVLPVKHDFTDQIIQTISVIPDNKVAEIALHPGYEDSEKDIKDGFVGYRKRDFDVATNESVLKFISDNNIELINYEEL